MTHLLSKVYHQWRPILDFYKLAGLTTKVSLLPLKHLKFTGPALTILFSPKSRILLWSLLRPKRSATNLTEVNPRRLVKYWEGRYKKLSRRWKLNNDRQEFSTNVQYLLIPPMSHCIPVIGKVWYQGIDFSRKLAVMEFKKQVVNHLAIAYAESILVSWL